MNLAKLNRILNELDYKYNINSGGCCFVACCLIHHFRNLGIKYKLVVLSEDYISAQELRSNIRYNKGYCTNCETANHYFVEVYGVSVNRGDFNLESYSVSKATYISPEELYDVYKSGSWNSDYDKYLNKEVFRAISKFFKPYEEKKKERTSSSEL